MRGADAKWRVKRRVEIWFVSILPVLTCSTGVLFHDDTKTVKDTSERRGSRRK